MACKADPLLPVTSAVETTTFCPGAALPMAATYSLMSTAGAGTHWDITHSYCLWSGHSQPERRTAVVRRGCGGHSSQSPGELALGYSWQEHGGKCWTKQHSACHCASAMVLPCMGGKRCPRSPACTKGYLPWWEQHRIAAGELAQLGGRVFDRRSWKLFPNVSDMSGLS